MKRFYYIIALLFTVLSSYAQTETYLPKPKKISCQEIVGHGYWSYRNNSYIMDNDYVGETIVFNYAKDKVTIANYEYFINKDGDNGVVVNGDTWIFRYSISDKSGETGMIYLYLKKSGIEYVVSCGGYKHLYIVKEI